MAGNDTAMVEFLFYVAAAAVANTSTVNEIIKEMDDIFETEFYCGRMARDIDAIEMDNTGAIVNATYGQFPWVALLGYKTEGIIKYECVGTLISKRHIVTTIECAVDVYYRGLPIIVRFGDYTLNQSSHRQELGIDRILISPEYRRMYKHNVALLRLEKEVEVNGYVAPICLPTGKMSMKNLQEETVYIIEKQQQWNQYYQPYYGRPVQYNSNDQVSTASIGTTGTPVPVTTGTPCKSCSRRKNKTWIDYHAQMVLDKSECISKLAMGIECPNCQYSTEGTICSGGDIKDATRCYRQTTGAPVYYEEKSRFYLVGLVVQRSWQCEEPSLALATKITDHVDWINENMK